jgi:hypothetical protein
MLVFQEFCPKHQQCTMVSPCSHDQQPWDTMSYSKSPNNTNKKRKKERYPNKAGKQDSEAQISDLHEKQEEKLQMHSQPEHVKYKKHLEDD